MGAAMLKIVATTVVAAVFATSAWAADLPLRAAPRMATAARTDIQMDKQMDVPEKTT